MRLRPSITEFRREPTGAAVRGDGWVYFCPDAGLMGFSVWGVPSERAVGELIGLLDVELTAPPHVSLVYFEGLEAVPPAAFTAMQAWLRAHESALGRAVTKQALVRPPGYAGSVVSGFYEVLKPVYPARVFSELPAALLWLNRRDDLSEVLQRGDPVVAKAKALLRTTGSQEARGLAKELGVSVRTLQRRFTEAGTSLSDAIMEARVDQAKEMLLHGNEKLTAIAHELGFASLQHFGVAFKKRVGCSPSAFRARANRPAGER